MPPSEKMVCPTCQIAMNQHAEKVDYEETQNDSDNVVFGGVIQEIHSCPGCGRTLQRQKDV